MTTPSSDTSGVRVLPPLIYAGLFLLGYAVHRFVPLRLWGDPPPVARMVSLGGSLLRLMNVPRDSVTAKPKNSELRQQW